MSGKGEGNVRIIAGKWRGRKIPVVDVDGLRPTSDRVRETLFNWLMPYVSNARCLDLFAGTGALGFEASSRGATTIDFVELNNKAHTMLSQNIQLLNAQANAHKMSSRDFLDQKNVGQYDLVFVDPPFAQDLIQSSLSSLESSECLAENALIYVESAKRQSYSIPEKWRLLKEKSTKQVLSCLFIVDE